MAIIFDGRAFAAQKKELLKSRIDSLYKKGVTPHLASIIVGDNPASLLYVGLKKKAAEQIGAKVDIFHLGNDTRKEELVGLIESLNNNKSVHGIMIQLPLPQGLSGDKETIINKINTKKDVDGLRADSPFLHPTSKAVIEILNCAKTLLKRKLEIVCVVGSSGMVGTPLVKELKKEGYGVIECSSLTKNLKEKTQDADVVVSTTGKENIIGAEVVKNQAIVIDVGSPKADVDFDKVFAKAAFITPVPGGVGPVTITCLLENLIEATG